MLQARLRSPVVAIVLGFTVAFGCAQEVKPKAETRSVSSMDKKRMQLGVNTANLYFHHPGASDTAVQLMQRLKAMNLSVLRFPGGTSANFYHPEEPGYGFRAKDANVLEEGNVKRHVEKLIAAEPGVLRKQGTKKNYIHDFAALAAQSNGKVLYVANLLTGSIEETLYALEVFEQAGAEVAGVELGNEYYLKAYARAFPSVEDYLAKAQRFATTIRSQYPDVAISAVAAPSSASKKLSAREQVWNKRVAEAEFYDAVSVHFYPMNPAGKSAMAKAECSMKVALQMANQQFRNSVEDFKSVFGNRPLWFTEWNVLAAPKWCNNSLAHTAFVLQLLLNMEAEEQIGLSIYHSLLSRGEGFNLLVKRPSQPMEDQFNAFALLAFSQLSNHLKQESYRVTTEATDQQIIYRMSLSSGKSIAAVRFNLGERAGRPLSPKELKGSALVDVITLNNNGLSEQSFTAKSGSGLAELPHAGPGTIELFLLR